MEDSAGHSSRLEDESKVDWLGFLVRYADCAAISQAESHYHALRHPLVEVIVLLQHSHALIA